MDAMKRFVRGIEIVDSVADQLNEIAQVQAIPVDRKDIWDVIHNLTDGEWEDIFLALDYLQGESAFTESDLRVIQDAREKFERAVLLGKDWVGKPYVKHKGHKNEVWQVWMRIREIVNRHNGIYIPNGPQRKPPKPDSNFGNLFQ
jgi:hypothetical protein